MGFVIWFKLEVAQAGAGGLRPLRVSNDVLSGDYILDATITIDLVSGAAASTFTATLANLPADVTETLKRKHREGPLQVSISLGYFDDPTTQTVPVIRGVITRIRTQVSDGLLETELHGEEVAGYWLLRSCAPTGRPGSQPLARFVDDIARRASAKAGDPTTVTVQPDPALAPIENFTQRDNNALESLRTLADIAKAPLVITDGKILLGRSVGTGGPVRFAGQGNGRRNIVSLDHLQEEPEETGLGSQARTSQRLTVLGDPNLRVGHAVVFEPADPKDALPGPLRVDNVRHSFSTHRGYTCDVTVVMVPPGAQATRPTGAHGVIHRIKDLAETVRDQRPSFDVGEVASYDGGPGGKHLTTLHYGQSPPASAVAPSVEVAVDRQLLLYSKPLASVFAFHKCGLVVPVLPGMRALLAHNRGLVNDAVVTGFVWAENPQLQPPKNAAGDWWLCLPTALDSQGMPTGKGVNDLTDQAGLRVIQAKGLRITVGETTLPEVGERPEVPGDLPGTLRIEHEAGTTIRVASDGAVTVDAGGKDITLTSGAASITLSGGSVKLHGTSVEVS